MKWLFFVVLAASPAVSSSFSAAKDSMPILHVDDPDQRLKVDSPGAALLETKLVDYERDTGLKILVQIRAASPSAEEDKIPGAYMRGLAQGLGIANRGVLVVYFADEDDWRMWLGDETAPVFVGRSGTARELTKSGAIHEAKEAFFTESRTAADAALAAQKKTAWLSHRRPEHRLNV